MDFSFRLGPIKNIWALVYVCSFSALLPFTYIPDAQAQDFPFAQNQPPKEKAVPFETITINAKDGLSLSADYYLASEPKAGVILLHGCHGDKRAYHALGQELVDHNMQAIALDMRGFGANSSDKFSHQQIMANADDIVAYQADVTRLTAFWDGDVYATYQFLVEKLGKEKDISVVSVGCSVTQAIVLAEKIRIESLVIVAPNIGHIEKEQYKNLLDFPTYFIAPLHHNQSYRTSKELFEWNGDNSSKFQILKGNQTGHILIRRHPELIHDIAFWLDRIH